MSSFHSLKPLVKRNLSFKHAAADIEANQWTKFEMGGLYDGNDYHFFPDLGSFVDFLCSKRLRNYVIYFHNGGKYDALFIIEELVRKNKTFKMIVQGARIVEIKIQSGKNITSIRDSVSLLPRSLKDLCETFAPERSKLSGSIDFEKERVSRDNELHRKYLEYDCYSLWEIIEKYKQMPFIRDTGPKLTTASTALAAWRTTLKKPIQMSPDHVQSFCREAYAGGRTEIFKTSQEGGACFDVNSLYPSMMLKPLPVEVMGRATDYDQFGFHQVTVQVPDTYIPILWTKKTAGKLIFPTGIIQGTFFSEELKLAIRQGARVLKYHEGYRFTQSTDIFKEFILSCYQLRLENPNLKNLPENPINMVAKSLMNNCYGKTAERELKKTFIRVDPNDPGSWPRDKDGFYRLYPWRDPETFKKWGLANIEKTKRSPHMLVHIAAAITAYGRVHMCENLYLPYQRELYYTDTDSAFITRDIKTGDNLGELKKEYDVKSAFYLLPKAYFIERLDGKIIRKIKGFPKKYLETLTRENFEQKNLKYREERFLSLRESLIRNNEFLSVGGRMKEIRATYDKRLTLPNGDTVPWKINRNGEIENGLSKNTPLKTRTAKKRKTRCEYTNRVHGQENRGSPNVLANSGNSV